MKDREGRKRCKCKEEGREDPGERVERVNKS